MNRNIFRGAGILRSSGALALGLAALVAASGCDDNNNPAAATDFAGTVDDFLSKRTGTVTRVDRMGMPAIATAVITSKDAYNAANPADDANGDFVAEITSNVAALHNALDDDLTNLGLTPCATDDCVAQAAPLVVPDVIAIDSTAPSGFPNGRRLVDTVMDVTLALVLLDLGAHAVDALVGVNPIANDVAFLTEFPYLAAPNRP